MRLVRDRDEWDVQLEGRLVRLDRPGAPSEILRADSAEDARELYRDALAERFAAGFVEAPDPVTDREARLVHADELQLRGDPAGELIAVHGELAQLDGADPKQRKRLENRAASLLDEHHDAWFGPLARLVRKPSRKPPPVPLLEVGWRLGFAEEVRLCGGSEMALHDVYAGLRELPLSRQILRLVIGPTHAGFRLDDRILRRPSYEQLVDAMLWHGIPSRLRELVLGDVPAPYVPVLELAHVRAAVAAAPALEALRIVGGHGDLAFASERLRVLEIRDVTRDDLQRLSRAELPGLDELVLRARSRIPPPAVFEAFPSLSRLTLEGFARVNDAIVPLLEYLIEAAPRSLRMVALPRCALDDRDLAILTENPERFQSLTRLDLRRNRFSRHLVAAVKRRVPGLRVAGAAG